MGRKPDIDHQWMPGRPGKYTGRYIAETGYDRIQRVPTPPLPTLEHREPGSRLGWRFHPQMGWTAEGLAQTIDLVSLPHSLFFVDTNFLTTPLDNVAWEALLKRDIVISPLVRKELQPWIDNPKCNAMMRDEVKQAIDRGHPRIHISDLDASLVRHGWMYYLHLLMSRKLYGHAVSRNFEAKHARRPSKEEFVRIVSPSVKERGTILAWKGSKDFSKPNFWADEELAVMAALSALLSANEVTILTRDHDVQEQFYKLLFLIEVQYWSMLVADRYTLDPKSFPTYPIPKDNCDPNRRFCGEDDLFFAPPFDLEEGWRALLPEKRQGVHMQCLWFSGGPNRLTFCPLQFNADQDMVRLLEVKGRTGGLNSDKLEGRNCHALPYPDNFGLRPFAAIATDRKVNVLDQFHCSVVDYVHALQCVERYEMLEWYDPLPNR